MVLSDHLAHGLLLGSLEVLSAFSLFLIGFIILYRYFSARRQRRFEYHYNRITEELLEMLTNPDPEAPETIAARNKNYLEPLTHALLDLARRIKGPDRERLTAVFRLALETRIRKDLCSPFLLRRLTAARLLEFFSELPEPEIIRHLLKDKPPVRLAAISAISRSPSTQTISYLFQALETDPSPNYQTYLEIFFPLGEALENELRSALKRPLPPELTTFYLELAGLIPLRKLYPDLLSFINSENKEIRIRAARAISRMELPESLPVLIKLAQDPAWEVQAQALLGLGRLKKLEAIPVLSQAMRSPHWHVRLNAKEALLLLGQPGIDCLQKISQQNEDRFAADMAKMGLREYQQLYQKV